MSVRHVRAALFCAAFLIASVLVLLPVRAAVPAMTTVGWAFGGTLSLDDTFVVATAADAQGNTYATGWSNGAAVGFGKDAGGNDITLYGATGLSYVAKFDAARRVVWAQLVSNDLGAQMVESVALDGASPPNVYVTGWFFDSSAVFGPGSTTLPLTGDTDIYMMKLSGGDGAVRWINGFGNVSATYQPESVAVRPDGTRAYVAGCACADGAFLARIDIAPSGGTLGAVRTFTGASGAAVSLEGVALTTAGDVFVAGSVDGGDLVTPQAIPLTSSAGLLARYDADLTTLKSISTFGTGAETVNLLGIATDASSLYLSGWMTDDGLTLTTAGGPVTLAGLGAGQNGFVIKASIADQVTGGNPGRVTWARAFGGPLVTVDLKSVVGVDAAGGVYVGATVVPISGNRPDLSQPAVTGVGTDLNVVALRLDPDGNFTDGVAMGTDAGFILADTTGVAADGTFTIGGTMTNSFTVPPVLLGPGVSSYGLMLKAAPTSVGPGPAPPPPPPPVVDLPVITAEASTVGGGMGSISFAASFPNSAGLIFSASLTGGGSLPAWLTFDPATMTLRYAVPIPADLPVQPLPPAGGDIDARASWPNAVYPPLLRLMELPVVLTATDRVTGNRASTLVKISFQAPRGPVAMAALSLTPDRAPGDRSSGRSALSFDGGQMVFETAATNLFPAAPSPYGDIVRYHALSGTRDRLSQTAIPGGGVANAANGISSSPAVSADGRYAAFASDAPSVASIASGGERQVYRVALVYPRVALNQARTPAPVMVSLTAAGVPGDGASDNPAMSGDGRFVAFDSDSSNLGDGVDGGRRVWRKDLSSGELLEVGMGANPSISWDGRYIAFEADGQIRIKDLAADTLRIVGDGASPRLSARADHVAFVSSAGRVVRVELSTGAIRQVGEGDQPAMSADGRFVAWRAADAGGIEQIWMRDVDRSVTALVTQTAAGTGGNGHSLHPAVSGDGTQVGFVSAARDLVGGNPMGTQAYLVANPLPLPEKTGYWYLAASNGGQGWLMERWGSRAYVGGLVYDAAGWPRWVSGLCDIDGLTCRGTLAAFANGAPLGAAGGATPVAVPAAAMTLTTAADGRSTTLQIGNGPLQPLIRYPIAGAETTGFAGLPQAGWWYEPGVGGGNGYFIAVQTQPQPDGSIRQMAYVSVLTFDTAGRPVWYSSQAALGADLGFSGTLMQYTGGATLGQVQEGVSGAAPVGQLRILFDGLDRARVSLPNGRVAQIVPNRF